MRALWRRHYSLGRFLAVTFAVAALVVALLLLFANTTGVDVGEPMTPATAPDNTVTVYMEEP